jgi:hypothetical protein
MKIGRYDRAPQLLAQGVKTSGGRINWTPNMIEQIRYLLCHSFLFLCKSTFKVQVVSFG